MTIKTIAVVLTTLAEAEWLIPHATERARHFDAHLIGVHPIEPVGPYAGDVLFEPGMISDLLEWQAGETKQIRAAFDRATGREGISAELRVQEPGLISGEAFMIDGVRAADMVMSGRIQRPGAHQSSGRLQEYLIRQCGRPVLIVPRHEHVSRRAERLLIGWSPTKEATRAAHDALALAAPGATIDLLRVGTGRTATELGLDSRQDLAAAFDRLGFRAELIDREAAAGEAAPILLKTALERGADLVATGAFGHSRAYDFVIGAVTSHLLAETETPVLLAK